MNLILGTAQFGMKYGVTNRYDEISEKSVHEILELALQSGINHFDTSLLYGNSVERLERFIQKNPKQQINIINKFSISSDLDKTYAELSTFLERSKLNGYHSLLIHDPDSTIQDPKKLEQFFNKIIRGKLTTKIGCSIYHFSEFEKLNRIYPLDIVQCPINPFNVQFLDANFKNVEIHARSLFLQGALLSKQLPERLAKLEPYISKFKAILQNSGMHPLEGLFTWAKQQNKVSKWVIGVTDMNELTEIIQACSLADLSSKKIDFSPLSQYSGDPLLSPQNWN